MTTTDMWPAPLPLHADPARAALPSDVLLTYLPPGGHQVAVRLDEAGPVGMSR